MKNIFKFIKSKPVLSGGIIFSLCSIIGNILSIQVMGMAHVYDIIHAFPIVILYDYIIEIVGNVYNSEYIIVPIAVIIDFLIGIIVGFILTKLKKTEKSYLIYLGVIFLIYWIIVTFQWLPII